ncbi:DUF6491 family protein [Phenylobacterium hankyongense]|uniref:DUF6491 family protein n=1 Tax=Phenylobacterium hankyongense TaxID=1813876 RepID=UPI001A9DA3FB|nr:DUF6491 family protein [Phenylobacterium hankyongense]
MKLPIAALIGAAVSLAACADAYPPPPPGPPPGAPPPAGPPPGYSAALAPDACFRTHDIRNHTVGDDHTLYIDVNGRDVYAIEMSGACLAGAMSNDPIIIREPPGAAIVCRPIDLDISIGRPGGGGFATPCIVRDIVRLTPGQVAALPPKVRP